MSLAVVEHRPAEQDVIAKATIRAAERLDVSAKVLAEIIGVSEATVSRLRGGTAALSRGTKPFELAVLFVRLFRSLDALLGGDEAAARAWLVSPNYGLGGRPLDLIRTVTGIVDVIAYLDARRAVV